MIDYCTVVEILLVYLFYSISILYFILFLVGNGGEKKKRRRSKAFTAKFSIACRCTMKVYAKYFEQCEHDRLPAKTFGVTSYKSTHSRENPAWGTRLNFGLLCHPRRTMMLVSLLSVEKRFLSRYILLLYIFHIVNLNMSSHDSESDTMDDLSSIFPHSTGSTLRSDATTTIRSDNATAVMHNRRDSRLVDLYMRQMPTSLMSESMIMRQMYEDDDGSYESDDSTLPPPPPSGRTSLFSIFRTQEDRPREAYIIEQKDSIESVDASNWPAHWNTLLCYRDRDTEGDGVWTRSRSRRLAMVSVASLLVLCGIIGMSVGLSNRKNEEGLRSSNLSSFEGGEDFVSTLSPTNMTAEDEFCQDSIQVDRSCYDADELATVPFTTFFTSCEPHPENWIGIYEAGAPLSMLPDPLLWLWTCNSQRLADCNGEGSLEGVLGIGGILDSGSYKAVLVARDGFAPFVSVVASTVFQISESC